MIVLDHHFPSIRFFFFAFPNGPPAPGSRLPPWSCLGPIEVARWSPAPWCWRAPEGAEGAEEAEEAEGNGTCIKSLKKNKKNGNWLGFFVQEMWATDITMRMMGIYGNPVSKSFQWKENSEIWLSYPKKHLTKNEMLAKVKSPILVFWGWNTKQYLKIESWKHQSAMKDGSNSLGIPELEPII